MNIRNFTLIGFASLGLVACQQAQPEAPIAPVEAPADPVAENENTCPEGVDPRYAQFPCESRAEGQTSKPQ